MGKKSDKKVKSDRINALRKQYDAFLEEDKKRKERNEYILGKLDNMRYNATAVQIRHKPFAFEEMLPVASRPEQLARRDTQLAHPHPKIKHPNHQNLQLDVHKNYLDNTSLLKEISKKYILIPKLRPSLVNDYVGTIPPQLLSPIALSSPPQVNITSNEDWKSKYDILEQLKNKENDEQTTKHYKEEMVPVKECQVLSTDDSIKGVDSYNPENYNAEEFTTKYEHEVPEKDLKINKSTEGSKPLHIEKPKISGSKDQEPSTDYAPKSSASVNNMSHDANADYDYTLQSYEQEHEIPIKETVLNESNTEENVQQNNYTEVNPTASEYNTEEMNQYTDGEHQLNENVHQEEYPVQYEQPVEEDQETYKNSDTIYLDKDKFAGENPITTETSESKDDEIDEYPVDMISVQEFTPTDDVKLVDGVNVNPNYLASEQNNDPSFENTESATTVHHTEGLQDSSGIEAFDVEQREMFYPENTQEFGYDQQESENVYNQEYSQNATEAQEHAYYESPEALQEQEYPAEVNEHEESTMQYDQNYEQQYTTDYGNQEYQEQDQPQYDQPEGYDQNQQQYQDYEYQEPDQETVQNVEQVLDNEQGYFTEQNAETNEENPVEPNQQAL